VRQQTDCGFARQMLTARLISFRQTSYLHDYLLL